MKLAELRARFDESNCPEEARLLTFHGVNGFDVYNCSVPFMWQGERYLFGRVERRTEWMRSWVRLFRETAPDEWTLVQDSMIYQMEDPFIAWIGGEIILGGTHVRVRQGQLDTYYDYFYRGTDLHNLRYFTTGPDEMKDVRLVEMADGRLGVFSRPRQGNASQIGFTVLDSLEEMTPEAIEQAPYLQGVFGEGEWGGCNQAYLLDSGKIGVIGHQSYLSNREDGETSVYLNTAFVLNPDSREILDFRVIGTRCLYPDGPAKKPHLTDCAFTSGIVMRPDGKADLYSGLGDCQEGRAVIPYPFDGYGNILR